MKITTMLIILLFILSIYIKINKSHEVLSNTWDLPIIPSNFNDLIKISYNNTIMTYNNKLIPRNYWIAFREVPKENERPEHLKKMLSRELNNSWNIFLIDNNQQSLFMETYFPNTSILHAFKSIHPGARVSAADIWRCCVLYAFGGVYMDDDAYIDAPFDDIIKPDDEFITAQEGNTYHDDCYRPYHNLSNHYLHHTFNTSIFHSFFGNRNLVTWALFSKPKHQILYEVLKQIVYILKHEYLHESVVKLYPYDAKWKMVMCATGPIVFTGVARKMLLEHILLYGDRTNFPLRVVNKDFMEYGGNFKVMFFEYYHNENNTNYMSYMMKHNIPILSNYIPYSYDILDNKPISKDGKHSFLMKNGTKYLIPDHDTFISLNFRLYQMIVLDSAYFDSIPTGEPLANIDFKGDWREMN